MGAQRKDEDIARKERVIFLVTKDELEAMDDYAKKEYLGNRSMVIREGLIKLGVFKKPK